MSHDESRTVDRDHDLLVVLCMHRSGSSLSTKALEILGYGLGPNLLPGDEHNERGYNEDWRIQRINDGFLSLCGVSWLNAVTPLEFNEKSDAYISLFESAVGYLSERLLDSKPFAFKDPRTALCLPLWVRVFEKLEVRWKAIIISRNVASICRSLARRDALPAAQGELLWLNTMIHCLHFSQSTSLFVLNSESLVNDPRETIAQLGRWLTPNLRLDAEILEEYCNDYLSPALYSSSGGGDGVHDVATLLELILSSKHWPEPALFAERGGASVTKLWQIWNAHSMRILSLVSVLAPIAESLSRHKDEDLALRLINQHSAECARQKVQVIRLGDALISAQRALKVSESLQVEAEHRKNELIDEMEEQRSRYQYHSNNLEKTVLGFKNSWSWKITAPIRLIAVPVFKFARIYVQIMRWFVALLSSNPSSPPARSDQTSSEEIVIVEKNREQKPLSEAIDKDTLPRVELRTRCFDAEYCEYEPTESDLTFIAFYLPQFHPFDENDKWWGKGFTEWTNTTKASPLFEGHYQPHLPIHLGHYDLRLPEVMREQARLAANYGIDAFSFYFYWFNGKTLMEQPLLNLLSDKSVDIKFCFTWANESWTRRWDGAEHEVLIGQSHSLADSEAFLQHLSQYFSDERYLKVDNAPLLIIYRSQLIDNLSDTIARWNEMARSWGYSGVHVVLATSFGLTELGDSGADALVDFPPHTASSSEISHTLIKDNATLFSGQIYDYSEVVANYIAKPPPSELFYPTIMMGWDNTARRGPSAHIFANFSLDLMSSWLNAAAQEKMLSGDDSEQNKFIFINAWNEWAEGTHLEPDRERGFGYLNVVRDVKERFSHQAQKDLRFLNKKESKKRIAIVIHIYYAELIDWLVETTRDCKDACDIYVTTWCPALVEKVRLAVPDATVFVFENRGRDMLPFIRCLKVINDAGLSYDWIAKVHGKKSEYRSDGDSLRSECVNGVFKALSLISEESATLDEVGLICSQQQLVSASPENMYFNQPKVAEISGLLGLDAELRSFPAGSMFCARSDVVAPLCQIPSHLFEMEEGWSDGTYAHAVERIVGLIVDEAGYKTLGL